ncbi:MAG: hypothetical protein RIB59_00960, partial [Rhodospirillales bacterium]
MHYDVKILTVSLALLSAIIIPGCKTALEHSRDVQAANNQGDRITIGTVQKKIRVGMSSSEVVEVLGSPNMVTTDSKRRENWVYDKISTQRVYSESSGGVNALILGGALVGPGLVGGGGGPSYSSSAGAAQTSQKTLTIIIKFD